jgi:hypothetical protein
MYVFYQPSLIAPVGHTPAQVPQLMQVSASISYFPSPWEIAFTGHSPAQLPQLTQVSLITYAMIIASFNVLMVSFYNKQRKYSRGFSKVFKRKHGKTNRFIV